MILTYTRSFLLTQTAYEQVKEAKEVATDEFKELIKVMINFAPFMGKEYSKARKIRQESLMESFNMVIASSSLLFLGQ